MFYLSNSANLGRELKRKGGASPFIHKCIGLNNRNKVHCPLVRPETVGDMPPRGGLSEGSYPTFILVLEKTVENS